MRFLDRPLAIATGMFFAGSLSGVGAMFAAPWMRALFLGLVQARMLSPLNFALVKGGELAVFVLVFANNSALVLLSFIYPFLIAAVHWVPELSKRRRMILLSSFTIVTAFIAGFFGFGGILALEWIMNGHAGLLDLLAKAWLHGPIEIGAVLLSVSEPLRLATCDAPAEIVVDLRKDLTMLACSLVGLMAAAGLEVYSLI